ASLAAAASARREGDLPGALAHFADAARQARGEARLDAQLAFAELAVGLSQYDAALDAAKPALAADAPRRRRALLASARALSRRGDLDEAQVRLEELLAADPEDEDARGALARLAVSRGKNPEALA